MWPCPLFRRAAALCAAPILLSASLAAQVHVSNSGFDSGDGRDPASPVATLGFAVAVAADGEEIRVAVGTHAADGTLVEQSQAITGGWSPDFSEQSPDPSLTVLDGGGVGRVLDLHAPTGQEAFVLENLTITGGVADFGAAMPGRGGGILLRGGGSLHVVDCRIVGNVARAIEPEPDEWGEIHGDASGFGGGIYASGRLSIRNSTIAGNAATTASTTFLFLDRGGMGGGVMAALDPAAAPFIDLEIIDSAIVQNSARSNNNPNVFGGAPGRGGGVAIGVDPDASVAPGTDARVRVVIEDSDISQNVALFGNIARASGGGIHLDLQGIVVDPAQGDELRIQDSTIDANRVSTLFEGFVFVGIAVEGGGIHAAPPAGAPLEIIGARIRNNWAAWNRGPATGLGGGVSMRGGELSVVDSVVTGNGAAWNVNLGRGGGFDLVDTKAAIRQSTISWNDAHQPQFDSGLVQAGGGGVYFSSQDSAKGLEVINTEMHNNRASWIPIADSAGSHLLVDGPPGMPVVLVHNSLNTATGPSLEPVLLAGGDFVVLNTAIQGHGPAGIIVDPAKASGTVAHTIVFGFPVMVAGYEGAPLEPAVVVDPTTIEALPGYEDPVTGGLELQPGAAAIDAGDPGAGVATDRNGNPRDDLPDIGAHEYQGGEMELFDFGDAPASYGTLLADDGARHLKPIGPPTIGLGFSLPGVIDFIDFEADGKPSILADADAFDDGVDFGFRPGPCRKSNWVVSPPSPFNNDPLDTTFRILGGSPEQPVFISAWLDVDGDGTFDGPNDKFVSNFAATDPEHLHQAELPFLALEGPHMRYLRVRVSSQVDLGPTGPASDGEVEDYLVYRQANTRGRILVSTNLDAPPLPGQPFEVRVTLFNLGPDTLMGGRIGVRPFALTREPAAEGEEFTGKNLIFSLVPLHLPLGTTMVNSGVHLELENQQELLVGDSMMATLQMTLPFEDFSDPAFVAFAISADYICGPPHPLLGPAPAIKPGRLVMDLGGPLASQARALADLLATDEAERRSLREDLVDSDANRDGVLDVADIVYLGRLEQVLDDLVEAEYAIPED